MSAPAASLAVPEISDRSASDRARLLAIAIFAVLSCYCAFTSQGFVAADACMHYLYARFAIHEPAYLVDVWGRPLVTALYALPAAWGGRPAVRCVSLAIAILCADVAYQIARGQKLRWPVLALLFTLGQPLLFVYSFGEMTELPFALLVGFAFLAYQRKRFWLMACLVALSPLARPEGFGFLLLAALALLYQRRSQWILVLPIPLIAWNFAGWIVTNHQGRWYRWLIDAWPYASLSLYGHGNVLSFVAQLPVIVSPLVLPATLLGIGRAFARHHVETEDDAHLAHCRNWIALLPLLVLAAHSLLYWTGRLASFGEIRYLLVAAPLWGVLSAQGWEWIFTRFQWRHPLAWAAAAILAPIAVNFYHPIVPIGLSEDWKKAQTLATWYANLQIQRRHPVLMAAHPGLFYFLDISPRDSNHTRFWKPDEVAARKPNTILVWDPIYGDQNASASAAITLDSIRRAGWREIRRINASPDELVGRPDLAKLPPDDARRAWHVFSSDPPPARRRGRRTPR